MGVLKVKVEDDWVNVGGAAGPGVAPGGTAGQILTKTDGVDYHTQWSPRTVSGASDKWPFTFSATITEPTAGNQQIRGNATPLVASTKLWVSQTTLDSMDIYQGFNSLVIGSQIYVQQYNLSTAYIVFVVTGPPINKSFSYWELPVSVLQANGTIPAGKVLLQTLILAGLPALGTAGQVLTKQSITNFDAAWQTPSGGTGTDEVWIGTADPIAANPTIELWYDTDAPAILTDDLRWNTAWGVIGSGSLTFGDGASWSSSVPLTTPISAATVVGRRYRVSMSIRAVNTVSFTHIQMALLRDGVFVTDRYQMITAGGNYQQMLVQYLVDGTGATNSYRIDVGVVPAGVVGYSSGGFFTVEDVGPSSAYVPAPNPIPQWIAPTLINGWVNFGAGYNPAGYRKIGDMVYLRGLLKSGGSGTAGFQLPTDCRPPYANIFSSSGSDLYAETRVNNDGNVVATNGTVTSWWCIDGLSFSVTA